jgi:hypothetical protein
MILDSVDGDVKISIQFIKQILSLSDLENKKNTNHMMAEKVWMQIISKSLCHLNR